MIRIILAFVVFIIGIIFSAYLGLWVCCIGGIIQMVEGIKELSGLILLIGFLKFWVAQFIFWLSFLIFTLVSSFLVSGAE